MHFRLSGADGRRLDGGELTKRARAFGRQSAHADPVDPHDRRSKQAATKDDGRLVNFIRGQRANEGFQIGSLDKIFRRRGKGVLVEGYIGDIVNSQPVYVGQPFANYQENNYGRTSRASDREPMLYVGANDGMLHAFYATTDTTVANHGQEAWAIIPSAVLAIWSSSRTTATSAASTSSTSTALRSPATSGTAASGGRSWSAASTPVAGGITRSTSPLPACRRRRCGSSSSISPSAPRRRRR
jgi:hypothetical protein